MVRNVLVIEDSLTSFLLISYTLKTECIQSEHASSIDEAILSIKRKKPDLIILDLNIPEVSGYDFLTMRKQLEIENIPIIVVSALDLPESIAKVKALGASEFIAKPLRIDLLVEKIKMY